MKHLIIIWPNISSPTNSMLIDDIEKSWRLIEIKEHFFNLQEIKNLIFSLYYKNKKTLYNKVKEVGPGLVKFIIIFDEKPDVSVISDNSGPQKVNYNLFKFKKEYRYREKSNFLHASLNETEFLQNINSLNTFFCKKPFKSIALNPFISLKEFFDHLSKIIPYIIIRGKEKTNYKYFSGDIDIYVYERKQIEWILYNLSITPEKINRFQYKLKITNTEIILDIHDRFDPRISRPMCSSLLISACFPLYQNGEIDFRFIYDLFELKYRKKMRSKQYITQNLSVACTDLSLCLSILEDTKFIKIGKWYKLLGGNYRILIYELTLYIHQIANHPKNGVYRAKKIIKDLRNITK